MNISLKKIDLDPKSSSHIIAILWNNSVFLTAQF